jgi:hypothetical protein
LKEYIDSSVLLRIVLQAPRALDEWATLAHPAASALLPVECLRTVDRLQSIGKLKEHEIPRTYGALHDAMDKIELLKVTDDVIERAGGSFGVPRKRSTRCTLPPQSPGASGSDMKLPLSRTTSR